MADMNPKLCECGCGQPAPIAKRTDVRFGHVEGRPVRFVSGHHAKRHGMAGIRTPTYRTWEHIIGRCTNPNHRHFADYAGRGIRVCDRWRIGDGRITGFECFLEDMGERPPGKTIDRKDNDGHYEPNNCRWATPTEQGANRRTSVYIEHDGETKVLAEWARQYGLNFITVWYRHQKGERPPHLFRPSSRRSKC